MPNGIRTSKPEGFIIPVSVNLSGEEQLKAVGRTLDAIASGNALQKYWKSQEALIEDVVRAAERYKQVANDANANELINSLNALRGMSGKSDLSGIIDGFEKLVPTITAAEQHVGKIVGGLSPAAFQDAFIAIKTLTSYTDNAVEVLDKLSDSSSVDALRDRYKALAEQLAETKAQLEGYEAGEEFTKLNDDLAEKQIALEKFENTAKRAKEEVLSFLSVHDIDFDIGSLGSERYFEIDGYLDKIDQGLMTSQGAIAKIRTSMSDLFQQSSSYGIIDVARLQQAVNLTDSETNSLQAMASSSENTATGMKSVMDIMGMFFQNMDGAKGEAQELQSSLIPVIESLKELAGIDPVKLDALSRGLASLRKLGDVSGSNQSLKSLAAIVSALSADNVHLENLAVLSGVKLDGFKDVKVSKTILYIGELTKNLKNIDGLEKLSKMQFENLRNIKIDKSAIQSIRDLSEAIKVLKETKAATATVTDSSVTIEEAESSKAKRELEYLKKAIQARREYYNLLKQTAAERTQGLIVEESDRFVDTSGRYANLVTQLNDARQAFERLTSAEELSTHTEATVNKLLEQEASLRNSVASATERAANKQADAEQKLIDKATELQGKYANLLFVTSEKKHGALYGEIVNNKKALDDLVDSYSRGEISSGEFKRRVDELTSSYRTNRDAVAQIGTASKSTFARLTEMAKKFSYWFSVTRIVMAAYRAFKQMVQSSIELESTFNQLQIVTGATDAEMSKFADTAINLAKGLGQSVTDVTKAIETFSRLGYTLSEAGSLAEFATILSNVANVDLSAATTGLTSIIKGFDLEVSDAEHVSDVLINVGQKFAVSASEMMDAYERAGAALNATNTSFEKSAALIAAANASVDFCRAA